MSIILFFVLFFCLQAACIAVSFSSGKMKNQKDYYLAGRKVGFIPLFMTFLATQVGGGLILGSAEEAYRYGWTVLLYPLGQSLGFILLGLGIGRRLAAFEVSTIAQVFEVAFGSTYLKKIASTFSIISLFLIFTAQVVASNKFMLSLGVDGPWMFILFWGMVIFYTSMGGLRAVIATDVVQAAFFITAFVLCFVYLFWNSDISLVQTIATSKPSNFEFSTSKLCGWLVMPLLFMAIEQDMGQRCFAASSPSLISKATLGAAIVTFAICLIPVFFGILGNHLQIESPAGSSIFMEVVKLTTAPWITAMVGCAILAAIISTADSLINAISSNVSQDFDLLKNKSISIQQVLTSLIAFMGIIVSLLFNNVVDLMILSYELSVTCLFVPLISAIYGKGRASSAFIAIAFGASAFGLLKLYSTSFPSEIIAIVFSFLGFCIGELIAFYNASRAKEVYDE